MQRAIRPPHKELYLRSLSHRPRIFLFLPLLMISCSIINLFSVPPSPTQGAEVEWKVFVDTEDGFSIDYPSSWFYFRSAFPYDELSRGGYILFSSTLGNTSIQSRTEDEEARLSVSIIPETAGMEAEEWLSESPLKEEGEVTRLTIGGYAAIRIETPSENEDDHSTHYFLFLAAGDRFFSLVGTVAPSERADLWRGVILTMQESFRVIS